MTATSADRPRIAALIRTVGELYEFHGDLLLQVTSDWSSGAKAANLDPEARRNRTENCGPGKPPEVGCAHCPHPVPSDPTGEAAIVQARADYGSRVQAAVDRMVEDSQFLKDAFHVLAPIVPPSTMNEKDDRWCDHHIRIGLAEVRHRGTLCRYCDDFLKLWKIRPPITLLRERHLHGKVTDKMVKDALAADGVILTEVGGVTKAIRQARGRTGRPNQNQKRGSKAS